MSDKTELRAGLAEFLRGGEKTFEFTTDCALPERVAYIHSVLFPGYKVALFYLRFVLARLAQFTDYSPLKVLLYRLLGFRIGRGVFLSPGVFLDPHFPELLELGDACIIGQEAILSCHEYSGWLYRLGRVKIGRGAVVGHGAVIMPGSEIPPMTCLPMRAVVTKNSSPENLYDFSEKYR